MTSHNKPKVGMKLHKQIALGAKPKSVTTTKGQSAQTIPGLKKGKK